VPFELVDKEAGDVVAGDVLVPLAVLAAVRNRYTGRAQRFRWSDAGKRARRDSNPQPSDP
jgi:hypothetical protein